MLGLWILVFSNMELNAGFSDADKILWKKIKRNGHFSKRKKDLIKKIHHRGKQLSSSTKPDASQCQSTDLVPPVPEPTPSWNEKFIYYEESSKLNSEREASDSESDEFVLEQNAQEFCNEIRMWAISHQIKHSALNSLLTLLKSHIPDNVLPKCARTLLQTPRCTDIVSDDRLGGQYWHYGLKKVVVESLTNMDQIPKNLSLNVNIDGLPTFKSSSISFWPILVNFHELRENLPPLIVGIFCGACNVYLMIAGIIVN